jgi:hypothetical protein
VKRSYIKRKRPRVDPLEAKIRASAEGEECTLRFDMVCNGRTDTTVYCHSNLLADGKGMGLKARTGCYGCSKCHAVLDWRAQRPPWMSYEEMIERFRVACIETQLILKRKGLKDASED